MAEGLSSRLFGKGAVATTERRLSVRRRETGFAGSERNVSTGRGRMWEKACGVVVRCCSAGERDGGVGMEDLSRRNLLAASSLAALAAGGSQGRDEAARAETNDYLPLVQLGKPIAPDLIPSSVIKGCWQLAGGHRGDSESDRTKGAAAVEDFGPFVEAGITTFDTADIYGPSESLIGEFIRKHGRLGLQICTKYCVFSPTELRNPTREAVRRGIDRSLGNLGSGTLDLVHFYWHDYNQDNFVLAAQYLAELQGDKIRHIGVTNFDTRSVEAMVEGGVPIVSSQVQYSLLDRRVENGHAQFCEAHGISLVPFGVVGGGFLTDRYVGMSYAEAQGIVKVDTYSKSKYLSVLRQVGGWDFLQDLLQVLKSIAEKHRTNVANVATRWVLEKPSVAAVIIGARNARHVSDYRRLSLFSLDQDDNSRIDEVLDRYPRPKGDIYTWERGGVF